VVIIAWTFIQRSIICLMCSRGAASNVLKELSSKHRRCPRMVRLLLLLEWLYHSYPLCEGSSILRIGSFQWLNWNGCSSWGD
jgi:hypothetical protein